MNAEDFDRRLNSILMGAGILSARELMDQLGVSKATLSRCLEKSKSRYVAIGTTRNRQYGLMRSISGTDSELPFYRVDEQGTLVPCDRLVILHGDHHVVPSTLQIFNGLPPEIADMTPQGFMGRAFCRSYARDLLIPERTQDWSNDHIIKVVALRGEDLPGNLIVGNVSAERWQKLNPISIMRSDYIERAELAIEAQSVGSSAGGERPKFSAVVKDRCVFVKFAGPLRSPTQRRWRDLLLCEYFAGEVLRKNGIDVCETHFSEDGNYAFLEVVRFDRVGKKGRKSYLSFAAVDDFLFCERDSWIRCAQRLQRRGMFSETDVRKVAVIEAFAKMIGDTDRHFYNLGLLPRFSSPQSLTPIGFDLAPVFDKLPMLFAPVDEHLVERKFQMPLPDPELMSVWSEAKELAMMFWKRVAGEKSISRELRGVVKLV